jgi:hypothetical protein
LTQYIYIYNCTNIRECPVNADINLLWHDPLINYPLINDPWIVFDHITSFSWCIILKYVKCSTPWLHIKKYHEYINRIYHIWMSEYYISYDKKTIVQDILNIMIYFLILKEEMICIVFLREPRMVETWHRFHLIR